MEAMMHENVASAMRFLRRNRILAEFVKNFSDSRGFAWSDDPKIKEIGTGLMDDGHSGASFALTMRKCQQILLKEDNRTREDFDFIDVDADEDPF
jgi:hypothetical protein